MRSTRGVAAASLLLVTASVVAACGVVAFVVRQYPGDAARPNAAWFGGTAPHPVLGRYFIPRSQVSAKYPDNPRGYFHVASGLADLWTLAVQDTGSHALLEIPPDNQTVLRVHIGRISHTERWKIQLRQSRIAVRRGDSLSVSFRARAESPRPVSFGVTQAHAPWQGLGLYQTVNVDTAWTAFRTQFAPVADDDTALLHFDLAETTAAVEFSEIEVTRAKAGQSIASTAPVAYVVSYRFDGMGCRGPERSLTRKPESWRIVSLGDSYALGAGVHERDTFAARLEARLNLEGQAKQRYEVINCAVPGFGTHGERLFYQRHGVQYAPDVVLLVMTANDAAEKRDEVSLGYRKPRIVYERRVSMTAMPSAPWQAPTRIPPVPGVAQDLRALHDAVRARGARLAVVLFREARDQRGNDLAQWVARGLAGTSTPVLDLGPALATLNRATLAVHPTLDAHPNEIAHRVAADSIHTFLKRHSLLRPGSESIGAASKR